MGRRSPWLVALALVAHSPTAAAEPPEEPSSQSQSSPPRAEAPRAIDVGREGLALFKKGRWHEAHDRFQEAERMAHSPAFVVYMARCKRALDRYLEARELYRRAAAERVVEDAPAAWHTAIKDAHDELARLDAEMPSIVPNIRGGDDSATLVLDGQLVARSVPIDVDPGVHRLEALVSGKRVGATSATIARGQRSLEVTVDLRPPTPRDATAIPRASLRRRGSIVPGAITVSVGVTGLVIGAVAGGLALARQSQVRSGCVDHVCREEDQGLADSAVALSHVSTAALVAGGALTVAGTVLLIVRPGGTANKTAWSLSTTAMPAGARLGLRWSL
jgi:hypothetical protein